MSMGLLQCGAPNPVVSTAIFVLSIVTLTNLLIATLVLLLPTMKQRAQKLQRQRGFHCLVYLALVCGNTYIALTSGAASFAPAFCSTKVSALLILLLQLMVAPISAQVFFLWRRLKKERPNVHDAPQRRLWTKWSSRFAYLQVVVILALLLAYLLVGDVDEGTKSAANASLTANKAAALGCSPSSAWDIAAFSTAFTDSATAPLLRALWLLTLVPMLLTAPLLCRVGCSRFIPLFGEDWKKLQHMSSALAVAFLWQLLSFSVEDPTVRLVAFYVEVSARTCLPSLLPNTT
jgi:hypothetical protein